MVSRLDFMDEQSVLILSNTLLRPSMGVGPVKTSCSRIVQCICELLAIHLVHLLWFETGSSLSSSVEPGSCSPSPSIELVESAVPISPEYSLSPQQQGFITNNEMLDCETVDAAVNILQTQYEFQSQSVGRSQAQFVRINPMEANFQIIHLHDRQHFVLTRQLQDCVVEVYDSLSASHLDAEISNHIVELYGIPTSVIKCNAQKQTNGVDCGVFCIANLVSLLVGTNPSEISFEITDMRPQLLYFLVKKEFSMFKCKKRIGPTVKKVQTYNLVHSFSAPTNDNLQFLTGCSQKGRPKVAKQRHYQPSYNRK